MENSAARNQCEAEGERNIHQRRENVNFLNVTSFSTASFARHFLKRLHDVNWKICIFSFIYYRIYMKQKTFDSFKYFLTNFFWV